MTRTAINTDELRRLGALIRLNGKDYLTHDGLVRVSHAHGLESVDTQIVSWDPAERAAVVRAVASGTRGTYSGIGDASPSNVGRAIASACLRMAETRAVSRALRLYTGLGMTSSDELPGGADAVREPAPEPPRLQPMELLQQIIKLDMRVESRGDLDCLIRASRRVPDTNEPHWDNWKEFTEDRNGAEWLLAHYRRLMESGTTAREIYQRALDEHGAEG